LKWRTKFAERFARSSPNASRADALTVFWSCRCTKLAPLALGDSLYQGLPIADRSSNARAAESLAVAGGALSAMNQGMTDAFRVQPSNPMSERRHWLCAVADCRAEAWRVEAT